MCFSKRTRGLWQWSFGPQRFEKTHPVWKSVSLIHGFNHLLHPAYLGSTNTDAWHIDYQKVRDVLEPEPYPGDWPELKKMQVFSRQAKILGMEDRYYRVPQTTRFRPGPNRCGVDMSPSTLTGLDSTGVNDGSKTTTLVTYLADAWNWGAEMFCQCEVRHIEKVMDSRGGYLVYFAWHGHKRRLFRDNFRGDLMWVHAKKAVFLGAGAIGTTEILLRSKALGLGMSDCVGQGMSGNGDMVAFGYLAKVPPNTEAC